MNPPQHVYEVYIRTTPEKLWEAITTPEMTRQYFYANAVDSDWKVGSPVRHRSADGPASKADGMIAGGNDWTPPRSQRPLSGSPYPRW